MLLFVSCPNKTPFTDKLNLVCLIFWFLSAFGIWGHFASKSPALISFVLAPKEQAFQCLIWMPQVSMRCEQGLFTLAGWTLMSSTFQPLISLLHSQYDSNCCLVSHKRSCSARGQLIPQRIHRVSLCGLLGPPFCIAPSSAMSHHRFRLSWLTQTIISASSAYRPQCSGWTPALSCI